MSIYTVMFVAALAVVVYFVWSQRKRGDAAQPARLPAATPATGGATQAGGELGSYDAYRSAHPSNVLQGKPTCHVCGSNLQRSVGGVATCASCSAPLYRG